MRKTIISALLIFISCVSALAQREVEMGWTGENGYFEHQTASSERPLKYYLSPERRQEFLRAETRNCALPCDDSKVQISQKEIGAPFGKRIIQIVYANNQSTENLDSTSSDKPAVSYWKSIVAETRPGMFREILLLKNEGAFWQWPPSAADLVTDGDTEVLSTFVTTSSRDMWCTGEFWVLQKSGPKLADFSSVNKAIDKSLPAGDNPVTPKCAAISLQKLETRVDVQQKQPKCHACGYEGSVIVKFKFDGARAVPVSSEFVKDSEDSQ